MGRLKVLPVSFQPLLEDCMLEEQAQTRFLGLYLCLTQRLRRYAVLLMRRYAVIWLRCGCEHLSAKDVVALIHWEELCR